LWERKMSKLDIVGRMNRTDKRNSRGGRPAPAERIYMKEKLDAMWNRAERILSDPELLRSFITCVEHRDPGRLERIEVDPTGWNPRALFAMSSMLSLYIIAMGQEKSVGGICAEYVRATVSFSSLFHPANRYIGGHFIVLNETALPTGYTTEPVRIHVWDREGGHEVGDRLTLLNLNACRHNADCELKEVLRLIRTGGAMETRLGQTAARALGRPA